MTPPRVDVLGIGQCSLDEVALLDAAPAPGGKARVRASHRLPGGQIATALLGCARLGRSAAFASSVGEDEAAEAVLAPLRSAGVDLSRVRRVCGARTQRAWIWIEAASGERTVLWERDARLALPEDAVSATEVASARAVLLDAGDLELALRTAALARAAGIPCVLDADTPAPGIERLLVAVDYPAISESLAKALFGSAEAAVRSLARAGARIAVVTLGRRGALAASGAELLRSPAFAVAAVDTTGAGDAFHAGFVHGLLEGLALPELLEVSQALAACNCRALGAQGGLPTRAELTAFLASGPPRAAGASRPGPSV